MISRIFGKFQSHIFYIYCNKHYWAEGGLIHRESPSESKIGFENQDPGFELKTDTGFQN